MPSIFADGLRIAAIGILGVFANLVVLTVAVKCMGFAFGKKPKVKKS